MPSALPDTVICTVLAAGSTAPPPEASPLFTANLWLVVCRSLVEAPSTWTGSAAGVGDDVLAPLPPLPVLQAAVNASDAITARAKPATCLGFMLPLPDGPDSRCHAGH